MPFARAPGSPQAVVVALKAAALIVMMVLLTGLGSYSNRPPTAVLGEVQVVGADPQVVVVPDPSVQLLDAVCVTNEPTIKPC